MGNNSSHKRTKVPKRAVKERLPDMDKARGKQHFFSHLKQRPSWAEALDEDLDGEGRSIKAKRAGRDPINVQRARSQETKIVLLLPLDKRQQRTEAAAGPGARPRRPGEDAAGARAATPTRRGAGDGAERHEGARDRDMKLPVLLLLLLDSRLQEEGLRAVGGAGGGAGGGGGAEAAPRWQRLSTRLVAESETHRQADLAEEPPRRRCRCPRPRP